MNHYTPTPWFVEFKMIYGAGDVPRFVGTTSAMRPYDVEFFLRAVNSHEELLAAAEDAVHSIESGDGAWIKGSLELLRAAIAKARGDR